MVLQSAQDAPGGGVDMSSSGPLRLSFGDSLPIHCAICKTGPCYRQRSFDNDTKALRASMAFSSAVPSLDFQITFFVDQEVWAVVSLSTYVTSHSTTCIEGRAGICGDP